MLDFNTLNAGYQIALGGIAYNCDVCFCECSTCTCTCECWCDCSCECGNLASALASEDESLAADPRYYTHWNTHDSTLCWNAISTSEHTGA
jgi:hypothetical protein